MELQRKDLEKLNMDITEISKIKIPQHKLELGKRYEVIPSSNFSGIEKEFFIYNGRNKNILEYHFKSGYILKSEYCDDFDGDLDLEKIKERIIWI